MFVFLVGRKWNSCVWSGCRSMSSFVRSVLVTVQPQAAPVHLEPVIGRGDTRLTRAATLYRLPARMADEVVGANPTMHTLVMVSQLCIMSSNIVLFCRFWRLERQKLNMYKMEEMPVNFLDHSIEFLCNSCIVHGERVNISIANAKWGF